MKTRVWISMLLVLIIACVFYAGIADAVLVLVNDHVIRDDKGTLAQDDDTYWIRDLTMFNGLTLSETLNRIDLINNDPNYAGEWGTWELAERFELDGIRDIWLSDPNGFDQISLFSITTDTNDELLWVGRTLTMWDENNWSEWGPLFYKSTLVHNWRGSSIFPENDTQGAWVKAEATATPIPTLNEWGLIILTCVLTLAMLIIFRRREEM